MAISGTDDMGAYTDTGTNTLPTQRPSSMVDYHTASGIVETDPDRADKTLKVPPPRRSLTQRR